MQNLFRLPDAASAVLQMLHLLDPNVQSDGEFGHMLVCGCRLYVSIDSSGISGSRCTKVDVWLVDQTFWLAKTRQSLFVLCNAG